MSKRIAVVLVALVFGAVACKKNDDGVQGRETSGNPHDDPDNRPKDEQAGKDEAGGDETGDDGDEAVDPKVARGEYIAKLGGCQFCHTPFGPKGPDMSKAWAGGLEVPEKIGTWRSPNITQHEETGIGSWTDEQIKVAIRQGKRPDGSQMYPIMPYLLYNKLSDEDADALVAYLRTIEPIENEVERTAEMKMPKIPAPEPKGEPAPPKSDTLAHGEYLVNIMHCVQCHTPLDEKAGGFDMKRAFAGGFEIEVPAFGEGVLYSSNLTPHETGIKNYSDQEIIDAIRMMKKKDGGMIQGPMALYQGSWFDLPDDDAKAIVAYLRSLPPVANKVPKSTFKPKGP